jgi:hypothetical protein
MLSTHSFAQKQRIVITTDIANFWLAYDQIIQTKDSLKQIELISSLFINKGTPGLKAIMEVKRYTAASYVYAINHYPNFWNSIRDNTLKADNYAQEIEKGIKKLKKKYPDLKPGEIYFTIGALRTGGTISEKKVLIGSEISMADKDTKTEEFANNFAHLLPHFATNPINSLTFLNVHEYIHIQQKTSMGNTLLAQTVLEGAAEFIATQVLNIPSPNPQIAFGKKNEARIKELYVKEMFSPYLYNWIWNSPNNEFKMRDLAYFVGYAICEKYYLLAKDKKAAIKKIIELDYNNENELIQFVEETKYFDQSLQVYKESFENLRPKIIKIEPFENGIQNLSPQTKNVTLHFSQSMNKKSGNFDFGPLGEKNVMWVKNGRFAEDGKSFSFEIDLEPQKQYQLLITDMFLDTMGLPIKPYLIDIKTDK